MSNENKTPDWKSHSLELEMVGINHRLHTTEQILKEMKNVLVEQNKTITEMVKLQEKQNIQERDLITLRKEFARRNEETNPILDEFKTTAARTAGILAASTFFLVMLQGIIGYIALNTLDRIDRVERTIYVEKVQK